MYIADVTPHELGYGLGEVFCTLNPFSLDSTNMNKCSSFLEKTEDECMLILADGIEKHDDGSNFMGREFHCCGPMSKIEDISAAKGNENGDIERVTTVEQFCNKEEFKIIKNSDDHDAFIAGVTSITDAPISTTTTLSSTTALSGNTDSATDGVNIAYTIKAVVGGVTASIIALAVISYCCVKAHGG